MPATVQAILAARIDRLAPEDKQLLQAAVPARVIKTQGERLPDATMDHSNLPDPVSDRLLALEQELIELRKKLENQDSPRLF